MGVILLHKHRQRKLQSNMSELPEKQVKRLRSLITEAETNIAAAKELITKHN